MQIPSMQELLEAGVHFGHQVRRWNPKMKPYIFTARAGVHVMDLAQTVEKLEEACEFVAKIGESGGTIIFLASKNQARSIIAEEAKRSGAKYITERWIGGLLTNWEVAGKNIKKLADLKVKKEEGEFKDRTKKENLLIDREIARLERFYGGLADLEKLPDALFVVDVRREENACREARKKGVPVVAVCDTNADLSLVDFPIPGNDDAIKAIKIMTSAVASAYLLGREKFEKKSAKEKVELAGENKSKVISDES
ncbi:MAG: 30S ribosomal protein S2 [Candidatus Curtissbacteria bacterium GW2011_GWA1_40_47]|uniref:Small ribosomal subunit protein uS2 n=1 Tax=Candidatus Curtissbacteria bacterium RIFOXYA1_FULL_41_14 TaxID=1797737 RepID=A0A1F5HEK5_9BACT|nr:MAG: 30S ribosomal protein S2 [Candidatus Curtissbacteria bacterium GW2011_GWB1_40_28]KKR61018.1 MAG: 30S ribosomal protein S2 [Candidatus Curtissbacteria bacterium GW2011_GWA2_40_31]KKR62055.1 MAG: 30S ribosomal protein S2 [Microgenomates group bacterium GW2011_GWC1_40_35]KKR65541.1 MAG: 30S ribosomal protein S2 [Candidatus Curtissbacteria bacterium GW2011_GWA1_40_47]KKR75686.1 MAG: 30S ribosomal protein S2 [Candidatus Curtissbacteria bacterium GW2011_GWD1_40_8]KKS01970.1 MAG: 30S ribosoma